MKRRLNGNHDGDDANKKKKLDSVISNDVDDMISAGIVGLVQKRGLEKTCWPSEVPRLHLKLSNWRDYLCTTRTQCFVLAKKGIIDIEQKGKKLSNEDLLNCKGPIRLRLRNST